MDRIADVLEGVSSERGGDADSDVVVRDARFVVREMQLSWEKLATLWLTISKYRTLFSDLTRGDLDNFLRFVTTGHSVWLEVYERDNLMGVICLTNMEQIIDTDAHVIFFDRHVADKTPICKLVVKWVFDNFPIQRISVTIPRFYYATWRLVEAIGFKREGEKRNAALIGGRWANTYIYGITRQEAAGL